MRLDRRFAIVTGLSLAWALVVSAVFYRLAGGGGGARAAQVEKTMVVAAQPLPVGASVTAEMMKTVRVPDRLFPKGGFSRPEEALERSVISPIQPDEALTDSRLAARGSGMGLAPMIPPGMRAISVRVNDVVGVAGFVLPGMRVDVLVTGRPPNSGDTITTTVLQNVTVLSAGQTTQADASKQSINVPVVTLLVSPADAEALTLANNEGHIQLVLRNSTDQKVAPTAGRLLRELYALDRRAAVPPPPAASEVTRVRRRPPAPLTGPVPLAIVTAPAAPPPPPAPDTIIMIRGNLKTVERFQ